MNGHRLRHDDPWERQLQYEAGKFADRWERYLMDEGAIITPAGTPRPEKTFPPVDFSKRPTYPPDLLTWETREEREERYAEEERQAEIDASP